jgi:acyl-CoA synthetase (AMP-forming)/AMP-acid ligase II
MEVSVSDSNRFRAYGVQVSSILAILGQQLTVEPGRIVLNSLHPRRNGMEIRPLTLANLAIRVQRARTLLAGAGVRSGDRVIISLSEPREFLAWILGCFSSGMTAVPIPAAGEMSMPAAFRSRVLSVFGDCSPTAVIVEDRARWLRAVGEHTSNLPALESAALEQPIADAKGIEPFLDQPAERTAFLQYTSGSTGSPKGVVITNGNLIANCEAIRAAARLTSKDHMVSWLPLHHDMGLIGSLFACIYAGMTTSIMTPLAFLGRPVAWLRAIHEMRATVSVGPTFGYGLCVQKIPPEQVSDLDLSCWRLAFVGAEPVTRAVLTSFAGRFSTLGFCSRALYPVYGLAEATLAATFPSPGEGPRFDSIDRARLAASGKATAVDESDPAAMWVTSVGRAVPGHAVNIVSPDTGANCGEREVGEVVLSGPSISTHYFGQGPDERRMRLHTGDLGYLARGSLHIVDRLKDLVIVGGQNYASSDIESAIQDVAGVRRGMLAAFSTSSGNGTEALVIVAEVDPKAHRDASEIENEIREHIQRHTGLTAKVVHLAPKGTIEKTTSGKLRRRDIRAKFEAGELPGFIANQERNVYAETY